MKRRIQGLVSSTSGGASRKRLWREDAAEAVQGAGQRRMPKDSDDDDEDEQPTPPPPPAPAAPAPAAPARQPESDEDAWDALEEAAGDKGEPEEPTPRGPNPVVWMDVSVASTPRGRVFFELFRDVVPRTAENFRKLCVGVPEDPKRPEGPKVGYKGTEFYRIQPGRVAEGGEFDRSADGSELKDENFLLEHAKGGLLSMANDGPHTNTSRFQVTFKPLPALDGKQVVFGQVLLDAGADSSERLHPLHWVGAMGTVSGAPLEPVLVVDSGECDAAKAQQLLSSKQDDETQSARYARAGVHIGKLEEAVSQESVVNMLELTEAVLDSLEWQAKKAERSVDGRERQRRAGEVEAGLKSLKNLLEEVEFKAGDVQGPDGKQGRKAKTQIFRVRDVEESLGKIY